MIATAARPPAAVAQVAAAGAAASQRAGAPAAAAIRSPAPAPAPATIPLSRAPSPGTHRSTPAPLAGYRTLSPQTLQLAEAARDSVFRQIALRLGGEGSELRMLLDPPELGEVDLHLVVEKGGALRLSIGAERPELLLALDKYMHELRQTLAAAGLDVTHTEVHARERGHDRHSGEDPGTWRPFAANASEPAGAIGAADEWWTAEGLQLWA